MSGAQWRPHSEASTSNDSLWVGWPPPESKFDIRISFTDALRPERENQSAALPRWKPNDEYLQRWELDCVRLLLSEPKTDPGITRRVYF